MQKNYYSDQTDPYNEKLIKLTAALILIIMLLSFYYHKFDKNIRKILWSLPPWYRFIKGILTSKLSLKTTKIISRLLRIAK